MRTPPSAEPLHGQALTASSDQEDEFCVARWLPEIAEGSGTQLTDLKIPSMSHLAGRRARQKRASVRRQSAVHEASEQRQTTPGSALATPVARNATLTSDRRSSSHLRAAASDRRAPTSSTRARASSAFVERSGPRQRSIGVELRARYW